MRSCALREPSGASACLQVPLARTRTRDVGRGDFDPLELSDLERIASAGAPRALTARIRELSWIGRADAGAAATAVLAYAEAALDSEPGRRPAAASAARALRRAVDVALSLAPTAAGANGAAVELALRIEERARRADADAPLVTLAVLDALERLNRGDADVLAQMALAQAERAVAAGSEAVALELFDRARRWLARSAHADEADVVPVLRSTVVAELARRRRALGAPPQAVAALLALASDELSPVASSDLAARIRSELTEALSQLPTPAELGAGALTAAGRAAMRAELRVEESPLAERWCALGTLEPPPAASDTAAEERDLALFGEGPLETARLALACDRDFLCEQFDRLATACVRLDAASRAEWRAALGAWLDGDFASASREASALVERDVAGDRALLDVAAEVPVSRVARRVARRSARAAENGAAGGRATANLAVWVLVAALAQREVEDGPFGGARG